MRAARLLQMLLLLQNRGQQTSAELAAELEVSTRTILRDVDAMTEAGLPIIVHQGNRGGIELGFDYRTRLTGLAAQEAEALGILFARPMPELAVIGLSSAARLAKSKITESFPAPVRARMAAGAAQFGFETPAAGLDDPRIDAIARAIRGRNITRLQARTRHPNVIHPAKLTFLADGCAVTDAKEPNTEIPIQDWGDINISAKTF